MPAKQFNFSVSDMRTRAAATFSANGEKLDAAFAQGAKCLAVNFTCRGPGLRMFRFEIVNGCTAERGAFIGQGATVLEAWSDAVKQSRETFRPKNDGKMRASMGITVFLPPRAGDMHARFRTISRSIESFQSDETFDQERARLAREAEAKRLAFLAGRAA